MMRESAAVMVASFRENQVSEAGHLIPSSAEARTHSGKRDVARASSLGGSREGRGAGADVDWGVLSRRIGGRRNGVWWERGIRERVGKEVKACAETRRNRRRSLIMFEGMI